MIYVTFGMAPGIDQYIAKQPADRRSILHYIHAVIIDGDMTITSSVELMMGKEMIVYKAKGFMKYGLSGVRNYMSLHVMPIYGSKALYEKYQLLLPDAKFQKGCINFKNDDELPMDVVRQLIADCAKIDLLRIKEDYLKSKKPKGK